MKRPLSPCINEATEADCSAFGACVFEEWGDAWSSACYANGCFFKTDEAFCLADKRWDGVDKCMWQDIPGAPYACVANDRIRY